MSCPVKLQALPAGLLEEVFTPENVRGRTMINTLSFPKSRSALWDGRPVGDKLFLQFCSHRKPHLLLSEKALRLAQRHVRHSNKPRLLCFFLGSVSVDSDEEGISVNLDRFDPGRDQSGSRVPSALLPGDILVPCVFTTEPATKTMPNAAVRAEAEPLRQSFKVLEQYVCSRHTVDLSQLIKVRGHVLCSHKCDSATFTLSWSALCPSLAMEVQPVRAVPIIPTALLRSLTSVGRTLQPAHGQKRGFLTMDQTRKLLLLLESDPKAAKLPLVGLWLSGVTHLHNPHVFAWCLRFLFSSALQDRVLSESGCFLFVLFADTHRAPQFFQCRHFPASSPVSGAPAASVPGLKLDCELLTAVQSVTLYQVAPVEGQTLQCELSVDHDLHLDIFGDIHSSFSSVAPPALGLSVSDQDSGVEDEDVSPRPSPSPHTPALQARRVQPSVPELSLLMDSSFSSHHGPAHRPASDMKCTPPTGIASPAPIPAAAPPPLSHPHLHSTPNPQLQQQPCPCCIAQSRQPSSIFPTLVLPPPVTPVLPYSPHCDLHSHRTDPVSPPHLPHGPTCVAQCCDQVGGAVQSDTYQLRLLQAQVKMLLEAQGKIEVFCQKVEPKSTNSIAVGTGDSLLWRDPSIQEPMSHPTSSPSPTAPSSSTSSSSSSYCRRSSHDLSVTWPVGGTAECDVTPQTVPSDVSPTGQHSGLSSSPADPASSPQSVSMLGQDDEQAHSFYHTLMTQLTNRLQESDNISDVEEEKEEPSKRKSLSLSSNSSPSSSSSSSRRKQRQEEEGELSRGRRSLTAVPDCSSSRRRQQQEEEELSRRRSLSALPDSVASSSSKKKQQQSPASAVRDDVVVSATRRQLQQLGVNLGEDELTEPERRRARAVERAGTLATINPPAVLSRLSVPDQSSLFTGGSVDLSLEANAIALRYRSDSQLSRSSLGGPTHCPGPTSSTTTTTASLLSPSNMSLATRKYMRRFCVIEEDEEGDDEEDQEAAPFCHPATEALSAELLPQSQLIRELRPKMQVLARNVRVNSANKENCPSSGRPSLIRASSRQTEGSVGNILDLSRLRQLPKLF